MSARDWLDAGPVPAPPRIPGPTLEQVDLAIAAAGTHRLRWYRRLMMVMRFTGLRAGQVAALDWPDFDLDGLRLTVRPELGKSRQERRGRVIPLHPLLREAMKGWARNDGPVCLVPLRNKQLDRPLADRAWQAIGYPQAQPFHCIRKAAAWADAWAAARDAAWATALAAARADEREAQVARLITMLEAA